MTIIHIATIKREAEEAAEAGKSPSDACRFPFHSHEGNKWLRHYESAGGPYRHALESYRKAIGAGAT